MTAGQIAAIAVAIVVAALVGWRVGYMHGWDAAVREGIE
jgi:hypothetical protein